METLQLLSDNVRGGRVGIESSLRLKRRLVLTIILLYNRLYQTVCASLPHG